MNHHMTLLISSGLVFAAGSTGCMNDSDHGGDIPGNAHHVSVTPLDEAEPMRFHSGLTARQRVVVRDVATWTSMWPQIVGPVTLVPPVPAIDFSRDAVIVTAMGTQSTGGYAIRVDDAATLGDDAWISVVEQSPDAPCGVLTVLTAPSAVVVVPRFDGDATFVEHTEVVNCK